MVQEVKGSFVFDREQVILSPKPASHNLCIHLPFCRNICYFCIISVTFTQNVKFEEDGISGAPSPGLPNSYPENQPGCRGIEQG